jgi:succinate dehydrogenase/fumarate reductase flavoprotein subunit
MYGYVEAPRAYWHAHGMARNCGVKLARAVVEGILSRGELASLVSQCQGCAHIDACENWLSRLHPGEDPPEFCAIGKPLNDLSPLR